MNADQPTNAIVANWLNQIEEGLESGVTPLIQLGSHGQPGAAAQWLAALRQLVLLRSDSTHPNALVGGSEILWLAALMQQPAALSAPPSPAPEVVFGGNDRATVAASPVTLSQPAPASPPSAHNLPLGLNAFVAPDLEPAIEAALDTLPMQLLEHSGRAPVSAQSAEPIVDWIAWSAVAFAVTLLAIAFVA